MKVLMSLVPNKKASFTVYQNVSMRIGRDKYDYSEAWTLNSTKKQYDYFEVPEELRSAKYSSRVLMWLEKGGIDKTYRRGKAFEAASPWGTAHGRKAMRGPPTGTKVLRRITRMSWNAQGQLTVEEERKILTAGGATQ